MLSGEKMCGKTQRAMAEFARPLKVNTFEDCRKIVLAGPLATTHLVFDEACFNPVLPKGWTVEHVINLLDRDSAHTFPARYQDITIPAMPIFFTTNAKLLHPFDHIFPPGKNEAQHDAIECRYCRYFIKSPMYGHASAAQGSNPSIH